MDNFKRKSQLPKFEKTKTGIIAKFDTQKMENENQGKRNRYMDSLQVVENRKPLFNKIKQVKSLKFVTSCHEDTWDHVRGHLPKNYPL